MNNTREEDYPREKHPSIELSDQEHLDRLRPLKVNKQLEDAGFVYNPPVDEEAMSPALKEKFEKARNITKHTKVVDLRGKDEKSKSKATERKPKKNNPKPNKPAVAKI